LANQLGGAWGGKKSEPFDRQYARAVALAAIFQRKDSVNESSHALTANAKPALQFGIRHLLWIAGWVSLLLSVIRLSGVPFEYVLPLLVGWLAYQAATLRLGLLLMPRLVAWWRGVA
jgi:hypothetical protein